MSLSVMIVYRIPILVACLVLFQVSAVPASVLDNSFGSGGIVTATPGTSVSEATAVVMQSDGRIVTAGTAYNGGNSVIAVMRFLSDGRIDTSFANSGTALVSLGVDDSVGTKAAIQPDGKILVCGFGRDNATEVGKFGLIRLNPDGYLDNSFGNGGKVLQAIGNKADYAFAVALQPDGKIILAGSSKSELRSVMAMARFNQDGSLDPGFGSNGIVTTDFEGGDSAIYAAAVHKDGRIVVTGYTYDSVDDANMDIVACAYDSGGRLDSSFGDGGRARIVFSRRNDLSTSIAVDDSGSVILGGYTFVSDTQYVFMLAKLKADGSPDVTFGDSGLVTTVMGSDNSAITSIVLQRDGKIAVAGLRNFDAGYDFALARYNPDGSLDVYFAGGGIAIVDVSGSYRDVAQSLVVQADGKPVAAGSADADALEKIALVRLTGVMDSDGGGSGGCLFNPNASGFDPALWLLLIAGILRTLTKYGANGKICRKT